MTTNELVLALMELVHWYHPMSAETAAILEEAADRLEALESALQAAETML